MNWKLAYLCVALSTGFFLTLELLRVRSWVRINWRKTLLLDVGATVFTLIVVGFVADQLTRATYGSMVGYVPHFDPLAGWPLAVRLLALLLVADFFNYWAHRLMHTKVLWPVHRWHHSIEQLNSFTCWRSSLLNGFLSNVPLVLTAFALSPTPLEILVVSIVYATVWRNAFIHTNVNVNLGPLEHVLITAKYHRIHHAREIVDMNFGFMFTFWDRLFGTYLPPDRVTTTLTPGVVDPKSNVRMAIGF